MKKKKKRRPNLTYRECDNPNCRKWYGALSRLVRKGRDLYCCPPCGRNAQRRRKVWNIQCAGCGAWFQRVLPKSRKPPKFCNRRCYLRYRKGAAEW